MLRKLFSRLRFKLSTLLILISALCFWLGYHVYHARVQREAVAAVTAAGGTVHYDHEKWPYIGRVERPEPSWMERVFGIDFVHSVVWIQFSDDATGVDAALANVSRLPKLKELFLAGDVTDKGLRHLTKCSRLETLTFPSTAITDRGLPFVGAIKGA